MTTNTKPRVVYHAGGKMFDVTSMPAGWYCIDGDGIGLVDLVVPGAIGNAAPLAAVGELAMDHWRATVDASHKRAVYLDRIRAFEDRHGRSALRIDAYSPEFAALRKYTFASFDAYKTAKRAAYNIKRRLENACRRAS